MERTDRIKHSTVTTSHFLTVIHSDKTLKECSQLALCKNAGTGNDWHETLTAQPSIWIYGKEYFNGSWDQLREILEQATEGPHEYQYKIGQPVHWSWGTQNDYVVIKRYNVGSDEATGNNGNRYQLADRTGNLHHEIKETELLPY